MREAVYLIIFYNFVIIAYVTVSLVAVRASLPHWHLLRGHHVLVTRLFAFLLSNLLAITTVH